LKVLSGPIGWAITGIWTAIDIASPAFRVTIPAVIQIAALRQQSMQLISESTSD
ncbi:MAG TPA: ubiquinol-cytochrome C chaperone family protein, partial [Pseudomonadales bacterium]|nr:ubiquinol-cytochrome C chaperone family protein [Pseudomonadales bacterium]